MSGGSSTSTSDNTLPSWLLPAYQSSLQQANALQASGGPQTYGSQAGQNLVAGMSPDQTNAISQLEYQAQQPDATNSTAINENNQIASGSLMNPSSNPYLTSTFNTAADAVQNQINSQFAGSGANVINSLPVQQNQLSDLANQIYGGAYNTDLNATQSAIAQSPALQASAYVPSQQLYQAGTQEQTQNQNEINAQAQTYNYNQQLPYNTQDYYQQLLSTIAAPFGQNTTVNTSQSSPFSMALGAASAVGGLL